MKLRMSEVVVLFVLGGAAALVGDHGHVATGTTVYYGPAFAVPFLWSSPIWFPAMVGASAVSLAELRLHLGRTRQTVTARHGLAGVAAVLGIYVLTALTHHAPIVPGTTLIVALAAITWCALGDHLSVVCGVLAAVVGPVVEIVLVKAGVFAYAEDSSGLFGVGPFLPPLYFAFGVVVALLAEIAVKQRDQEAVKSSDLDTSARQ